MARGIGPGRGHRTARRCLARGRAVLGPRADRSAPRVRRRRGPEPHRVLARRLPPSRARGDRGGGAGARRVAAPGARGGTLAVVRAAAARIRLARDLEAVPRADVDEPLPGSRRAGAGGGAAAVRSRSLARERRARDLDRRRTGRPNPRRRGTVRGDRRDALLRHRRAALRASPDRADRGASRPPDAGVRRADRPDRAALRTRTVRRRRGSPDPPAGRDAGPARAVREPDHRHRLVRRTASGDRRHACVRGRARPSTRRRPGRGRRARAQGGGERQGRAGGAGTSKLPRRSGRALLGWILRGRAAAYGSPRRDRRARAVPRGAAPVQRHAVRGASRPRRGASRRGGTGAARPFAGDRMGSGQLADQRRDAVAAGRLLLLRLRRVRRPAATAASRTASQTRTAAPPGTRSRRRSSRA